MNEEQLEDINQTSTSEAEETIIETEAETEEEISVDEQDSLKVELDKVKGQGRTKEEKLLYSRKRIDDQLRELRGDDGEVDEDDEDRPITVKEFKKLQQDLLVKSSLQLADDIPNETERELVKHYLTNVIRSTGNPKDDLNHARAIVNSKKNARIVEEASRKGTPKTHVSGTGAPAKVAQQEEPLTHEEKMFLSAPFNMTKEEIIKARG